MKISGLETARITKYKLIFKLGKYRLYNVSLQTRSRYLLIDKQIRTRQKNLKRYFGNLFVRIG